MTTHALDLCALCGLSTETTAWVILNRWVIGTGSARAMVEARDDEGDYSWEMHPEGSAEDEVASGRVLHWPLCATQWIEAKMIETDLELRTR